MPKFDVKLDWTFTQTYERTVTVEAEDEDSAHDAAMEYAENNPPKRDDLNGWLENTAPDDDLTVDNIEEVTNA